MNKKLLAIAVAAALSPAVASADATVYGRIHVSADSISGSAQTNNLFLNSNSSRFGVKGSEDLGGGMKALYQLEAGVNATGGGQSVGDGNGGTNSNSTTTGVFTNARDMYVGVAGDFGAVLTGRLGGSNQYVYDSNLFGDQIGDAATFTNTLPGRLNSVLAYATPNMNGFDALVAIVPGSALSASNNSFTLKLNYAAKGIGAHLFTANAYAGNVNIKPLAIAGSYDFGAGMVTAQYVKAKVDTGGTTTTDQSIFNIGGQFNVSDKSAIKAQISKAGDNNSAAGTGASMIAIGYDYSLSKRTGLYVAFAQVSNDAGAKYAVDNYGHAGNSALATGEDPKAFSVGLTHNF